MKRITSSALSDELATSVLHHFPIELDGGILMPTAAVLAVGGIDMRSLVTILFRISSKLI